MFSTHSIPETTRKLGASSSVSNTIAMEALPYKAASPWQKKNYPSCFRLPVLRCSVTRTRGLHPYIWVAELALCTMSSRPRHRTHRSYHRADCNLACESPREGDVAAAFWERYKWLDTGVGLQTKELLWFLEIRKFLELLLKKTQ